MKHVRIVLTSVVLSGIALFPAAAPADEDELEVTMEVLDSIADIDGDVIVMPGPEDDSEGRLDGEGFDTEGDGIADHDAESDEGRDDGGLPEHDFVDAETDDEFTHDEDFESDEDEEHSEWESDFDEGDEIDTDEPDEMPMDDEEPMHDEEQFDGMDDDQVFEDDLVSLLADSEEGGDAVDDSPGTGDAEPDTGEDDRG